MPDDPEYRAFHRNKPDEVTLRDAEDDGMMEIRLPIASTGEVRNEGDDPLSGAELRGMAQQVDSLTRGVFPEHGMSNAVDGGQYSQFEKLGYWADADIERDGAADDEDLLMATARMPDPETLPAATGDYRQALAILKEQAIRGIPIAASIGWRDDPNAPGGVDLTEASIVGIGADPRTNTGGGQALIARAAVEAGADPEALVETVRAAVDQARDDDTEDTHDMTDDDTPPDEGDTTDDEQLNADTPEATREDDEDEEEDEEEQACPECETAVRDDANYCHECGEALSEREDDEDEDEDDEEDDEEQAADESETETQADDAEDLTERVAALEDELAKVRAGEVNIDTPDDDTEDDEETRSADDDADAQPDMSDPADKPDWAT